jgi:pyridoxine 5-phosphate synthase
MIRLHINIDHVATIRNQRDTPYPDPAAAAQLCLEAGADGITAHLREDRRHIRDADVSRLRQTIGPGHCFNLEMAATEEMAAIARRERPNAVTLVPERREERTTEGGLDVRASARTISSIQKACEEIGASLSLFIEPSLEQVRAARELGAAQVEFHTGHYCEAEPSARSGLLRPFIEAAGLARELGLKVAAGHGLSVDNVGPVVGIPHLEELNIGHSVVSEAVLVGLPQAVRNLRAAIQSSLKSLKTSKE